MLPPLANVTNLNGSAIGVINNNSDKIEAEFEKVLYKDGSVNMGGPLDMDSNRIINLPRAVSPSSPVTLEQFVSEKKGDQGVPGPAGGSNNSFATLAEIQARPPSNLTYSLASPTGSSGGYANGSFTYQLGDFTGRADVIVLDSVPITTGALVRTEAKGVSYGFFPGTDGDVDTSLKNRPNLLDAFAKTTQTAIVAGTWTTDLATPIRDAIQTGASLDISRGTYPVVGGQLEVLTAGQHIRSSGGIFKRLNGSNGTTLLVTADDVKLSDFRFIGPTSVPTPGPSNDIVRLAGANAFVENLYSNGSRGGNLVVIGDGARIINPTLLNAFQNNLQIVGSDIQVINPVCRFTEEQNNIFTTASPGSIENGEVISNIVIVNPFCTDASDTGIEFGYHTYDSKVLGGQVRNSVNPPLLQRDGLRNQWSDIQVFNKTYADQLMTYDAVAVVPAFEPSTWDSASEFNRIQVHGRVKRSVFYSGQSGLSGSIYARAYENGVAPAADGSDLAGVGIGFASNTNNFNFEVDLDGYKTGVQTNLGSVNTVTRSSIKGKITGTDTALQFFGSTLIDCKFQVDGSVRVRGANLANSLFTATAANPERQVRYYCNFNADSRFTGASAPAFNDYTAAVGLLTSSDEVIKILPASGSVALTANELAVGSYSVTVLGTTRSATFAVNGQTTEAVRTVGATDINGPATATGIQLTYQSGALFAFQRDGAQPALALKISGKGVQ